MLQNPHKPNHVEKMSSIQLNTWYTFAIYIQPASASE